MKNRNLDCDPRFWLVVASLLPFMVVVEVVCRLSDLEKRVHLAWRNR